LLSSVDPIESLEGEISTGGRVNAYKSLLGAIPPPGGPSQSVCFINTFLRQNKNLYEIEKINKFKNNYILSNTLGKKIVNIYYQIIAPEINRLPQKTIQPILKILSKLIKRF
jgi:hypothetical protein